jgi:hypothetical protein
VGRLSSAMAIAVAVPMVAALVAGCTGKAPAPRPAPEPAVPRVHRLDGRYTVHGIFKHRNYGAPCKAADAGYADIHPGTPVVVRDTSGAVVGSATLGAGSLRQQPLRGRDDDCLFQFSLTVPDRAEYRIEVSIRGAVAFSKADLERARWTANLTIGAYTAFGGD